MKNSTEWERRQAKSRQTRAEAWKAWCIKNTNAFWNLSVIDLARLAFDGGLDAGRKVPRARKAKP